MTSTPASPRLVLAGNVPVNVTLMPEAGLPRGMAAHELLGEADQVEK
jgi:hypothetical protein